MLASTTLNAVFTLVFTVTGVYSLARVSRQLAGSDVQPTRDQHVGSFVEPGTCNATCGRLRELALRHGLEDFPGVRGGIDGAHGNSPSMPPWCRAAGRPALSPGRPPL